MTDRDQSLQDAFDRHLRGEGPPPERDGDPDAEAYRTVYSVLAEEPEGDLSPGFSRQVASRVGLSREPVMGVVESLLLLLLIAGAGAGLVWMPPTFAGLPSLVSEILRSLQTVSGLIRLDVVVATAFVLAFALGFDTLLSRWRPARDPS